MTEKSHYMDLRLPMGIFFLATGLLIFIYGMARPQTAGYRLFGGDVNVVWGGVIILFGLVLLLLVELSRRRALRR